MKCDNLDNDSNVKKKRMLSTISFCLFSQLLIHIFKNRWSFLEKKMIVRFETFCTINQGLLSCYNWMLNSFL